MKNIYKKISTALMLALGLSSVNTQAQVNFYSFAQTSGAFTPIVGATVIDTATANTIAGSIDDKVYPITLPFAFNFGGAAYTSATVSSNGFITLGTTATPTTSLYTPISSTTAFDGVIAAWGRDINAVYNIAGKNGKISHVTLGVAPNRTIVVEWTNFRPAYTTSTTNAYVQSFQIHLQETTNVISIVYSSGAYLIGSTTISGTNAQVGLRGTSNADFNNRFNATSTLFTASTKGTVNTNAQSYNTTVATPGMPSSGLTYTWTPAVACSGTPTAGTITSSNTLPCPNTAFSFSLSGNTQAIGIHTAWQISTNGTIFTATGDTSISVTNTGLIAGDSIYYRMAVSCSGGAPVYSNVIKVLANPNFYQCYCSSTATSTADDDIGGFAFGSFTNNVSITPATNNPASVNLYTNYTNLGPIQAQQVVNYPVTITQINQAGAYGCDVSVFIDLDHSGTYDAGEQVYVGTTTNLAGGNVLNGNVSIPSTSLTGLTGLRVVLNESGLASACGTYTWGETEDYIINITPGVACTGSPTAGTLTAGNTTPCPSTATTVSLSGTTQAVGITTSWETSANGTTGWVATGDSSVSITNAGLAAGDSIYYRVAVSCSGGAPVYSNIIKILSNPNFYQCYCNTGLGGGSNPIDSVQFIGTTLHNTTAVGLTSNVSANYSVFPASGTTTGSLSQALTYTLNVGTAAGAIVSVWIDYDHSGTFDASEWTQVTTTSVAGNNAVSIFIPTTASLGNTGMRIRSRASGNTNGAINACSSFGSGETEDYVIKIMPGVACSGTPTAGNLTATNTTPCPGVTSTVTLAGTTQAVGITTSWQTSANGSTGWVATGDSSFSIINGGLATGDSIYYRVAVSCNGGAPVYTNIVKLKANPNFFACYCSSTATNTADDDIGGFVFGSFTNNVSITPALGNPTSVNLYTNFTSLAPIQAQQSINYPITITQINSTGTFYSCTATIFVDFNHSGTFDAGENIYTGTTTAVTGGNVLNGTILMPSNSLTGLTGLRVVLREAGTPLSCGTYSYGETEDYIINITPGIPCAGTPTAGVLNVNNTMPCAGVASTITLSGTTQATGITTSWETSLNGINYTATGDSSYTVVDGGLVTGDSIYYRVAVSCNGGAPVYTNVVKLKANPNFYACYCSSGLGGGSGISIDSVKILGTTLYNKAVGLTSNVSANYSVFPSVGATTASLMQSLNYSFSIGATTGSKISVWIDYDQSGTFDATEWTQVTTNSANANTVVSVNIPLSSSLGLTGMRVRNSYTFDTNAGANACSNMFGGETEDYIINIIAAVPCTGTPTAGTITATNLTPCPSIQGTLTLMGTTQAIGISTVWESSIDGINFTATGDSSSSIVESGLIAGDSIYYRVAVSCNGGAPVYSNVLMIKTNPNTYACYCSTNLGGGGTPIDSVSISPSSFSNVAIGTNSNVSIDYSKFSATGTILRDSTYTINVGMVSGAVVSMWIDYNHSGVFDSLEWRQVATTTVAGINSALFTVPAGAMLGNTGLRIRSRLSGNPNAAVDACTTMGSGETEDYIIKIDTILPITPPVGIAKQIASINFVAYPNPTMDVVTIAIAGITSQTVVCEVLNSFGQVVYTNKIKNVSGVEKLNVNLANYASGSYMIRVTSNDNVTVKRIVLQR
ncbi:MAG: T9SS type A sorting domain-containing protein [Bacteroidia bacterium]|nr:T9SS type A sorting domain-containing protein [Bacteroidia bacterium]